MINEKSELTVHLDDLRGWEKLNKKDQKNVWDRTLTVLEALHAEAQSKTHIGQQLMEIRKILTPLRMWISYLDSNFGWSVATAYRYIEFYEQHSRKIPKPVLEAAMRRGFKSYQMEQLAVIPPPATDNQLAIGRHLDKVETMPREVKAIVLDGDAFLKESVNYVGARFDKLPTAKARISWVRSLFGMLLTRFGFGAIQSFEPLAIPEEFRLSRGRPVQKAVTIH